MNVLKWLRFKTEKTLIQAYGPPDLEPEHDPVVQLDREYEQEVREEEQKSGD